MSVILVLAAAVAEPRVHGIETESTYSQFAESHPTFRVLLGTGAARCGGATCATCSQLAVTPPVRSIAVLRVGAHGASIDDRGPAEVVRRV